MAPIPEQRLFDALATISRACGEGGVPPCGEGIEEAVAAMPPEAQEVLGEAALAVAYGAFAARGGDGGAFHALIAAMGLLALLDGEEPDPPQEIHDIAAEDARVEQEIDRAGEAVDGEFGRGADPAAMAGALEARILGSAITLAGCTLPEGTEASQAKVRLRAARGLLRLAAGMLAMNAAGSATPAG